jgi:F-type H+-transporting ATPase subunit epsilon
MATLQLEIITPEKKAYSEQVDSVVLPGVEGEFGVLPNHVPMLTMIKSGELVVTQKGQKKELAIGDGYAEVTGSKVTVLTDVALTIEEIDEDAVERAIENAKKALEEHKNAPNSDQAAALARIINQGAAHLHIKRRRKV